MSHLFSNTIKTPLLFFQKSILFTLYLTKALYLQKFFNKFNHNWSTNMVTLMKNIIDNPQSVGDYRLSNFISCRI